MVTDEIVDLHVAFEEWFDGRSETLGRVEAALGEEFTFVGTTGMAIDRDGVLGFLRAGKATNPVTIRIENVTVRWRRGSLVAATYEEWQTAAPTQPPEETPPGGETTGRISTAVFEYDESLPGSLRWLSVHETWRAGHGPTSS